MKIILFFTHNVSLKAWAMQGLIQREILIYKKYMEDGHEVSFLTYGDDSDRDYEGILDGIKLLPVYSRISKPRSRLGRRVLNLFMPILIAFRFRKELSNADVFKTNQMNGAWIALFCAGAFRKKFVVRCGFEWYRNKCVRGHCSPWRKFAAYWLERISYKRADAVIISNLSDLEFINHTFHIPNDRIAMIRNFIDVDTFRPMEASRLENRILFVGRIVARKNLINLVKALEGTGFGLDIIGAGGQKPELEKLAAEKGVDLNFFGSVPNDRLPEHITRYPLFVLLSRYENNPKTLLEAMSCGAAVLGTDVEGIRELIEPEINGFLCGVDTESIRQAIQRLMPDSQSRMDAGRNAREFVLRSCALDTIFKTEERLLQGLL